MKTTAYLLICTIMTFYSCSAQTKKEEKTISNSIHRQEKGKPEETIKVNKHYDKNGKLVSFDSTYTSFYENRKGNKFLMDSLVKVFKKSTFNEQFPSMNDRYFKNLFLNDSLIDKDFFHEDFFRKRFELNENYLQKMMSQMDSVKNEFFKTESIQARQR